MLNLGRGEDGCSTKILVSMYYGESGRLYKLIIIKEIEGEISISERNHSKIPTKDGWIPRIPKSLSLSFLYYKTGNLRCRRQKEWEWLDFLY